MSSTLSFNDGTEVVVLKQYLRDRDNKKTGLMVCVNDPETNIATIGWSHCSPLEYLGYSASLAHEIAYNRAATGKNSHCVPFCILYDIFQFQNRCQRYYKESVVNITGILPMTEEEFRKTSRFRKLYVERSVVLPRRSSWD